MTATVRTVPPGDPAEPGTPRRWVGLVGVAVLGLVVAGPLGAILGPAGLVVAPVVSARRERRRAARGLGAQMATVFEITARALRSGAGLPDALAAVARTHPGPAVELLTAAFVQRGTPVGSTRTGVGAGSTLGVVTAIVGMVGGTAGGTARGLEAGAMILRERERAGWEVAAGIAQARTSATLLSGAPVVLAAAALVLVPGGVTGLLTHPLAVGAVAVGIGAEAVGLWWTRRLIRAVQGEAP